MARIHALPALGVIKGLRGVLDFYYWKGIPCVRSWPRIPFASRTPASLASAKLFGEISAAYALLPGNLRALYAENAEGSPRTGRDVYMAATHGHLHVRS